MHHLRVSSPVSSFHSKELDRVGKEYQEGKVQQNPPRVLRRIAGLDSELACRQTDQEAFCKRHSLPSQIDEDVNPRFRKRAAEVRELAEKGNAFEAGSEAQGENGFEEGGRGVHEGGKG